MEQQKMNNAIQSYIITWKRSKITLYQLFPSTPPPHGMGPPPLPPYLMHFAHATVAKLTFPYFCMHAAVAKRTFSFCWMNPLAGFGGSIARNCGEMQILSSKNGSAQCTGHFNAQQMESYTYTYPCTYIFININSYICKNIYVYLHIHICTYPYTYRYIHIYINIYIHTSSTATTTTTHTTGGGGVLYRSITISLLPQLLPPPPPLPPRPHYPHHRGGDDTYPYTYIFINIITYV